MHNPTQYLALFNLQKYIQNNLQVLSNVNIFKANGLPHRTYVTLSDLALLLIFIGIIILKNYVIIYCLTETKEESPENIGYLNMYISIVGIVIGIVIPVLVIAYVATYRQLKKFRLFSGDDQRTSERHSREIISQSIIQDKSDSTHDAGQEEIHAMKVLPSRDSDIDSLLSTTDI